MNTARWKTAAVVAAIYLVVALATLGLSGHRVLPLFEGLQAPAAYRWVHPPPEFAASNVQPASQAFNIPFTGGHTFAAVIQTSDAQFVINLAAGSFPVHGADTAVSGTVMPLDPGTLGPLPPGLAADGNAYRVTLAYDPSGTTVSSLAVAGNIVMTAPHRAEGLLFSPDGHTWSRLASQPVAGPTTLGAVFSRPGWYLVGALPSVVNGSGTGGSGTITVAVIVALAAVGLGAIAVVIYRRRRA